MRHRWSVPVAALVLAGGSMLAVPGAALASTAAPSPGAAAPPSNWSGYNGTKLDRISNLFGGKGFTVSWLASS